MRFYLKNIFAVILLIGVAPNAVNAEASVADAVNNSRATSVLETQLVGVGLGGEEGNEEVEYENEEEYLAVVEAARSKMDCIIIAGPVYVRNVNIIEEENGMVYFTVPRSKRVNCFEMKNVELIAVDIPKNGLEIELEDLQKEGLVVIKSKAESQELIYKLASRDARVSTDFVGRPGAVGYLKNDSSKNDTKVIVLKQKAYLPRVTVFNVQQDEIRFKYDLGSRSYGLKKANVEAVVHDEPKAAIEIRPGILAINHLMRTFEGVNNIGLPRKKTRFHGISRNVQNLITLEPIGFLFGAATVEYERMVHQNISLAAGYKFNGPGAVRIYEGFSPDRYTYWGFQGAIRCYPLEKFYAPRGLWFGPVVESVNERYDSYKATVSYTNILAEAGWGFLSGDRVGVYYSPFLGVGYSWANGAIVTSGGRQITPSSGLIWVVGTRLGFGF